MDIEVPPIPEGWTPLDVVCVIKCLDADGHTVLAVRRSSGITSWEGLGMAQALKLSLEGAIIDGWTP